LRHSRWASVLRHFAILIALALSACAPPGYMYDVGNFTHPHPTPALCASRGQVLDMSVEDCVTPSPPPLPTPFQIEQSRKAQADLNLLQHCDPRIRARYDEAIAQLSNETVEYMQHSHQNETVQEFVAQNDITRLSMRLQAERLQACRDALKPK